MNYLLPLALLVLTACSQARKPVENALHLSINDDLKTPDPATSTSLNAYTVLTLSAESLYQYAHDRPLGTVEPLLAEGMPDVTKDGLAMTIRL